MAVLGAIALMLTALVVGGFAAPRATAATGGTTNIAYSIYEFEAYPATGTDNVNRD